MQGELLPPIRADYEAEQNAILVGKPHWTDFGAFLKGKIERRTIRMVIKREFAGLPPDARAELDRSFEHYMALGAGTQRPIGDAEIGAIVNKFTDADPDGVRTAGRQGGHHLNTEGRSSIRATLPYELSRKLMTSGRAQQVLVTVVWEDGMPHEPSMHQGWYREMPRSRPWLQGARYELPNHRVYVRFLPAHAAPMDMAAGRAQTSDLEGPMLVNLPDMPGMVRIRQRGEYLDSIEGNAEETARDREAVEAGTVDFQYRRAIDDAKFQSEYWKDTGRWRASSSGLFQSVRASLESHDELQTLWGFPRRSQTEDIAEYQSFNRNHGSSSDGQAAVLVPFAPSQGGARRPDL